MLNKAEIDGAGNIVIQDSDNTVITINSNNPEEIRQFFIDFQNKLSSLPKKILELMESKESNKVEITTGANVYLGLNLHFQGNLINGISFSISITNLTKENRYFTTPFFKLSNPFDGDLDTFLLIDTIYKVQFPKKFEYGEVVTESYMVRSESKEMFDKVLKINRDATIQVIVTTTIGEIYKSNEYKVSQLIENFKYAK